MKEKFEMNYLIVFAKLDIFSHVPFVSQISFLKLLKQIGQNQRPFNSINNVVSFPYIKDSGK